MKKYEIRIGKFLDLATNREVAKQKIIITQDQLNLIEYFANTRKDAELNTIYILNDCEFTIHPVFDFTDGSQP